MPNERVYNVICADGCTFESMTKEQILTAIEQAVSSHTISDVDTGFVTTLKEQNANTGVKFWFGTTAQFNALATKQENTVYILTDDDTEDSLEDAIADIISGEQSVGAAVSASYASKVDLQTNLQVAAGTQIPLSQIFETSGAAKNATQIKGTKLSGGTYVDASTNGLYVVFDDAYRPYVVYAHGENVQYYSESQAIITSCFHSSDGTATIESFMYAIYLPGSKRIMIKKQVLSTDTITNENILAAYRITGDLEV